MSVGEVGAFNDYSRNSLAETVEKDKGISSNLGAQILEKGGERKVPRMRRRLSAKLNRSSLIPFDQFVSKETKQKESTTPPSPKENQTQTTTTVKIFSKKKHSPPTTERGSCTEKRVKKSHSAKFASEKESFAKADFLVSSISCDSLLHIPKPHVNRSSQGLSPSTSSYIDPKDSKELALIKSIRNFEREKKERSDFSHSNDDNSILKKLHQENKVTSREACLGYKATMSTETFIATIHQYYKEISSHTNSQEEEKIKKCECLMLFKEWLSFHHFYLEDFKNFRTVEVIKSFCLCLKEEFGQEYYNKLIHEINEIITHISIHDSHKKKLVKTLRDLLDYFNCDVKAIAEEFFRFSIQLQSKISSEIFNPLCSINQLIYNLNDSLTNLVVEDLLEEDQNDSISVHGANKKQLKKQKDLTVKKYEFYISLIRETKTYSHIFWCSALLRALDSKRVKEAFQNEDSVKKWVSFLKEAGAFIAGTSEEAKHQRKTLSYDKNLPILFNSLFVTCTSLKDKFPVTDEGWIHAGLIVTAATIAEDLLERQKCTAHLKTETNLFDLLWWNINEEENEKKEHLKWKT